MGILDDAIREHLELKRSHGANEEEVRRKEEEAFGPVRQEAGVAPAPETHVAEPASHDFDSLAPAAHEADAPQDLEAHEPTEHELDPLEPAPEDPYAVHPGDHPVPDPNVHEAARVDPPEHALPPVEDHSHFDTAAAAEAGAGMLEPHEVEPGPPLEEERHFRPPTDEHPALVDHDRIHQEEHPPEPVFRREPPPAPEAPAAQPASDFDDAFVDEPTQAYNVEAEEEDPHQGHEGEELLEETPEFLQDAPEHDRLWFEQKPPRDFDFGE